MSNQQLNRPKIKIPKTKREWIWDCIGLLTFLGSVFLLLWQWDNIPDKVPGHYNALGEVDRWGEKWELLFLPGIGAIILILLGVLERFPEVYNYPKRFNESNAEQFYLHNRMLLNQLKNISQIIFAFILYESVSIALGWGHGFGQWFLPVGLLVVAIPIILSLIKQRQIK